MLPFFLLYSWLFPAISLFYPFSKRLHSTFLLLFLPFFLVLTIFSRGITGHSAKLRRRVELSHCIAPDFRYVTFSPLSTKPLCFWAQLRFAADTYANNCYQLLFHCLVIVFAQLLISPPKGLLEHAISDMLLKLCFTALIYYYLYPLISFSVFLKHYCLLPVVLFQTAISTFSVGSNFCTRLSDRTAPLVHLRSCSALVKVQLLQLDTTEYKCLPCASSSVQFWRWYSTSVSAEQYFDILITLLSLTYSKKKTKKPWYYSC